MKRKQQTINTILILILLLLLGWGSYSWLKPGFPKSVASEDVAAAHRVLEVPQLSRQHYSNIVAGDVTRLNLFRKARKKYYRPKPPKPKKKPRVRTQRPQVAKAPPPPPKPIAPPPKLILTGVILLNGKQVAIFNGTYSEVRGGELKQNLKPRRRGYKVGETLGGYRIEAIHKTYATLSEIAGNRMTLKVSKTSPLQKIQKTGSQLTQKSKPTVRLSPGSTRSIPTRKSQPIPVRPNRFKPGQPIPGASPPPSNPSQPNPTPPLRQKSMGF